MDTGDKDVSRKSSKSKKRNDDDEEKEEVEEEYDTQIAGYGYQQKQSPKQAHYDGGFPGYPHSGAINFPGPSIPSGGHNLYGAGLSAYATGHAGYGGNGLHLPYGSTDNHYLVIYFNKNFFFRSRGSRSACSRRLPRAS